MKTAENAVFCDVFRISITVHQDPRKPRKTLFTGVSDTGKRATDLWNAGRRRCLQSYAVQAAVHSPHIPLQWATGTGNSKAWARPSLWAMPTPSFLFLESGIRDEYRLQQFLPEESCRAVVTQPADGHNL